MKTLECDNCCKAFTFKDGGYKFNVFTFCSIECLQEFVTENCETIHEDEFDGEDDNDIRMSYAND